MCHVNDSCVLLSCWWSPVLHRLSMLLRSCLGDMFFSNLPWSCKCPNLFHDDVPITHWSSHKCSEVLHGTIVNQCSSSSDVKFEVLEKLRRWENGTVSLGFASSHLWRMCAFCLSRGMVGLNQYWGCRGEQWLPRVLYYFAILKHMQQEMEIWRRKDEDR